jgi:hypothetical protein
MSEEKENKDPTVKTGRERSKDNLNPFKPGQSGNPKGRPRGSKNKMPSLVRQMLADKAPDYVLKNLKKAGIEIEGNPTLAKALMARLLHDSTEGNNKANKLFGDYGHLFKMQAEITGKDGEALIPSERQQREELAQLSLEELAALRESCDKRDAILAAAKERRREKTDESDETTEDE